MEKLTSTTGILIGSLLVGVLAVVGFAFLLDDNSEPWQLAYARQLDLDIEQFQADLDNPEIASRVEADYNEGVDKGVTGTPSFFVNGIQVVPQVDIYSELKLAIETSAKNSDTPVVLEEYADFQCPACGSAFTVVEILKEEFGEDLVVKFKHFPLEGIHPFSKGASIAAEAAREQGKFEEMYVLLFLNQSTLTKPDFSETSSDEEIKPTVLVEENDTPTGDAQ